MPSDEIECECKSFSLLKKNTAFRSILANPTMSHCYNKHLSGK